MKKYEKLYYTTAVVAVLILGYYIHWIDVTRPATITFLNAGVPLIGALVLFALTLVMSVIAQNEISQTSTHVADSEYVEIDDDGEVVA